MKTLEQIKNDYAKVQHYDNWDSLLNKQESLANIEWNYNNIIELAQKECLKLASENVICNENYININGIDVLNEFIVKQAITNENNIIK